MLDRVLQRLNRAREEGRTPAKPPSRHPASGAPSPENGLSSQRSRSGHFESPSQRVRMSNVAPTQSAADQATRKRGLDVLGGSSSISPGLGVGDDEAAEIHNILAAASGRPLASRSPASKSRSSAQQSPRAKRRIVDQPPTSPPTRHGGNPPEPERRRTDRPPIPGPAGMIESELGDSSMSQAGAGGSPGTVQRRQHSLLNFQTPGQPLLNKEVVFLRSTGQTAHVGRLDAEFEGAAWKAAKRLVRMDDTLSGMEYADLQQLSRDGFFFGKVPMLVVLIHSLIHTDSGDAWAQLVDTTGTMEATLAYDCFRDHHEHFEAGSVLVLVNVPMYSPCAYAHQLIVTRSSVHCIFRKGADTPARITSVDTISNQRSAASASQMSVDNGAGIGSIRPMRMETPAAERDRNGTRSLRALFDESLGDTPAARRPAPAPVVHRETDADQLSQDSAELVLALGGSGADDDDLVLLDDVSDPESVDRGTLSLPEAEKSPEHSQSASAAATAPPAEPTAGSHPSSADKTAPASKFSAFACGREEPRFSAPTGAAQSISVSQMTTESNTFIHASVDAEEVRRNREQPFNDADLDLIAEAIENDDDDLLAHIDADPFRAADDVDDIL